MPLFSKSQKSPAEICKAVKDGLLGLNTRSEKKQEKALEEVSKYLQQMKTLLYGAGEQQPQPEQVAQLAQQVYSTKLLQEMVHSLHIVEFESKKDIAMIFTSILRRQLGTRTPTVEYLADAEHSDILFELIKGYERPDIALSCGLMLRECARYESLTKLILNSPDFYKFFEYVEVSTFDIASDAFATFKELLIKHKMVCSVFLEKNYDRFFTCYYKLLNSQNYVTRRQALKLLGEMLLDRHNFSSMTRYISNPENLKLMMNMLRERSRNIQFEAFHVFKVFVANPNKPKPIVDILSRNRERLVGFLSDFHTDRTDDEQFTDEREYLIKQIRELPAKSGE